MQQCQVWGRERDSHATSKQKSPGFWEWVGGQWITELMVEGRCTAVGPTPNWGSFYWREKLIGNWFRNLRKMPVTSPALRCTKINSIHQGLSGIRQEDQAPERQNAEGLFCDWNREVGEVASVKVPKGRWKTAWKRSRGNCNQRRGSWEETAGESGMEDG